MAAVRAELDLIREPVGGEYRALVEILCGRCPTFSLVYENSNRRSPEQGRFWERLAPVLSAEREVTEWPGTTLHPFAGQPLPILATYETQGLGVETLLAAKGLYDWQWPARPADLAFYGPDGQYWLGSVAHERLARLAAPADLVAALRGVAQVQLKPIPEGNSTR